MRKEKISLIIKPEKNFKDNELVKHMLLNRKSKTFENKKKNDRNDTKKALKSIKRVEDI
jgi:hypothetical protein